ncbi:Peroxidase 2 [Dichanthelium oligosanthes]|uniref:peroxidase n=1 Tax=Dichanthelium oligosanthes TaxID=888268 RepID=A0A1E5WE20_9POAL|nr:Peroxidase 2 [Dichanthelium oligosanthes]
MPRRSASLRPTSRSDGPSLRDCLSDVGPLALRSSLIVGRALLLVGRRGPLGCDASILLNDTNGEQSSVPNAGLVRGYGVIDNIKAQVEAVCPQTVSCADILAVAAHDSVVANKNLDITDMVALSGAHTIGQAQCLNFRDHIYTDTNINSAFAASRRANCPMTAPNGDTNLEPLDVTTPNTFDNAYYSNLLSQKGLLHSDQELFNNGSTDNTVRNFASNAAAFSSAFTTAMVKMGNIQPLTGTQGQIRLLCWRGCDASVLLADTGSFTGEQGAIPNKNSIRGFNVIDEIKTQVEAVCNQTVSCADILAVAARDSVVALGGPSWTVLLGRRDSTNASKDNAERDLPAPSFDLVNLTKSFSDKGLSVTDMVALSGGHTIGQAQCRFFRDHIYNDTNINSTFASSLQANCPRASGSGDTTLAPLDTTSPTTFDNAYFSNLLSQKGLLHSDQQLFNGGSTDSTVRNFASSASAFSSAFTTAMVNMGNISPKTGTQGQIRVSCSKVNS